jgi:hypothetical protein
VINQPFAPAPLDIDLVLDPRWLEQALSIGRSAVSIRSVTLVEQIGFTAVNLRIEVDYAAPPPAGLPSKLCIKGVFDERYTEVYLKSGIQKTEGLFYRDLAPTLDVHVPACFYAGIDEQTSAAVIVMEDLKARDARFLSVLDPYSFDQLHQSLDQIARLHGGTDGGGVGEEAAARFPWIVRRLDLLAEGASGVSPSKLGDLLHDARGDRLPEAIRSGERLYEGLRALVRRSKDVPTCVLHGDIHAGNLFDSPQGIGVLDWQVLQLGHWSIDVAYHISSVLEVEDRRAHEQEFLRYYLARLAEHGGHVPSWEEAWRLYRQSVVYGYFMWGVTQRVTPAIIAQFVTRLGTALADHDSYGLLGV